MAFLLSHILKLKKIALFNINPKALKLKVQIQVLSLVKGHFNYH